MPSTVPDLLARHARARPAAPAIVDADGHAIDYATLHRQVAQLGAGLAATGFGTGCRIATALPNGGDTAVAMLAAMSGPCCAPLDPSLDLASFTTLLRALRADALLAPAGADGAATAAARALGVPILRLLPASNAIACRIEPDGFARPARPRAQAVAPDDVALVLRTSGTIATPKLVALTHAQLVARAQVTPIVPADRGLCAAPMFTVSAIEANLVATMFAGASVAFLAHLDAPYLAEQLERLQPTYLWAPPSVLKHLVEALVGRRTGFPPSLRLVRTGGAPLPPPLQRALEDDLGVPVMQGYGMTETGTIARNPLPPAPRPHGSAGRAVGPEVAIIGDDARFLATGETGEIVVRGPGVASGYEDDANANRRAFHEGWFRTGDLGHFDEDGYLFLTGRRHDLINRGGLKVAPTDVDTAMLRHPAVLDAAAFPVPHPSLGEDVVVAVMLRAPGAVSASALREHARRHLAAFQVPTSIVVVDALPRNAVGEVRRDALAEALGVRPRPEFEAARDAGEARIADVFAAVLKVDPVGRADDFFELGGDSLAAAQVVTRLNEACRLDLSVATLFDAPTVAALAAVVRNAAPR